MFCIAVDPTYSAVVKGELAGGLLIEFDAIFRRLTVAQLEVLRRQIIDEQLGDDVVVARVLAGWGRVVDASGQELPFSSEALAQALQTLGVQELIVKAFFESLPDARRKN